MQTVNAQDIIIETGSECDTFYIIADGTVEALANNSVFTLKKGDIVGIFDLLDDNHICTYRAATNCSLIPYPYKTTKGLLAMLNSQEDLRKLLLNSINRNICNIINTYKANYTICQELYKYIIETKVHYQQLCKSFGLNPKVLPFSDDLQSFTLEDELPFWMNEFYTSCRKIMTESQTPMSANFVYGYLCRSCQDISKVLQLDSSMLESNELFMSYLMNENYLDFYDLYSDLYLRARSNGEKTTDIVAYVDSMADKIAKLGITEPSLLDARTSEFKAKQDTLPPQVAETADDSAINNELSNSLGFILEYSCTLPTTVAEFKKYIEQFKKVSDRSSTEKDVDIIRKQISKLFFLIYSDVIQAAVSDENVPTIIKMFLNFGYVDAELCGQENAVALYRIAENFHGNKEQGIYTTLEWFKEIFIGNKQPSRNEFEQDYAQYVRTLAREGKINKEAEMQMNEDTMEKVRYELNNMFQSVNKITFGRVFTYCPVLIEDNILRTLDDLLLTPKKILDTVTKLNEIDYSVFYHEYIFEDTKINVKDTIRVDIRPDIILMPNAGSRGVLWQEIEGMNRKTPGRMIISALFLENLEKAFVRMFGEFRWEMCKREQGARWNDVTSHSLTSDYCDYAQFFAKNRDISYDTKEKIKETLKKCKNSFKEMFLSDYMLLMMYESAGSCRLNKTSRFIVFRYCPFGQKYRDVIKNNTIFEDCLSKHHITTGQALHRLDQIEAKYRNSGVPLPEELAIQRELLER
ncbi:MAG: cyclic nucleotide-binding domain-containing protein [Lachnospiraceae bacterium]|nr:cyclic nucleotide-binding domain-containing protein [Candidatus Colinaster equi]